MREREEAFDLTFHVEKLPEYNGLFDKNLRHHFESRSTQKLLHGAGLVCACATLVPRARVQAL